VPHLDDQRRFVVIQLIHRGQRLADEPFKAEYPGLLTEGIEDPATWVYRGIVADCLRGFEVLAALPDVDRSRIGILGDDLALLTAARRPGATAVVASDLMFHGAMERAATTDAYPIGEIADHLRARPGSRAAVETTLAHADPIHHAARVRAPVLLPVGDPGSFNGPEALAGLLGALGGGAEAYALTHEGQTDRDWIDAWVSGRLGVPAAPRLWEYS
jgi:cephalosporin-C deacetylase-like acetyl esterase